MNNNHMNNEGEIRTVKVEFEVVIRNKFVNQHLPVTGNTISDKGYQMPVVDTTYDLHLRREFPISLPASRFQAFHGNFLPIWQYSFMNVPESPLPQQICRRESWRRRHQLVEGESALTEPKRHRWVRRRQRWSLWPWEIGAHVTAGSRRRRRRRGRWPYSYLASAAGDGRHVHVMFAGIVPVMIPSVVVIRIPTCNFKLLEGA